MFHTLFIALSTSWIHLQSCAQRTRKKFAKTASKLVLKNFPCAYVPKLLSYFKSARSNLFNAPSTISTTHTEREIYACKVASSTLESTHFMSNIHMTQDFFVQKNISAPLPLVMAQLETWTQPTLARWGSNEIRSHVLLLPSMSQEHTCSEA